MKRIEDVNITRSIIIGTSASLIKNPTTDNTHTWKFYVKSPTNTPMNYISKAVLTLHETFKDPVRTITHPFVLEEKGWGEFNINVKLFFNDLNEKFITLSHFLKLYGENNEEVVVNEKRETIVFRSPSKRLYDMLDDEEACDDGSDEEKIENALKYVLKKYEELP
ncbi:hypothetical protein VCUG_02544 [Vavraia culicis subsp. floridensis]|uniref:Protein AF-9 homolog n=1 Tax=Vavraia culicis (isolate floridensis) TaxID=948595 RepID=L2GSB6_VAVCU|nr:uncharacterized protein VCUG_02544 [Vavraia culicis subsp. floridensis]ELA45970.1 hypothetical protein VCUG_02544 [Vavraia culicis subsp. floridensis]